MVAEDEYAITSATAHEYYASRYRKNPYRDRVWEHVTNYLAPYWRLPADASVLELGCGYGSWIKSVRAARKHALDICPDLARLLEAEGVRDVDAQVGTCTDLSRWSDSSLDLVLASNLLEHLSVKDVLATLREVARVLRPSGSVCIVQPNFAICPREYFDDYTHVSVFTDRSLRDVLAVAGLEVMHIWKRFLPFSMKPTSSRLTFLVPIYLRSPWKPMAGQMCLIARKKTSAPGSKSM